MPRCPVPPCRPLVHRRLAAAGLAVGLTAPAGLMTALPAQAQTAPVTVAAHTDACGAVLIAEAPREVLLAVTSVPLDVVLARAPEPGTAEPAAAPTAGPSPSPDPVPTAVPEEPVPLQVGPEPLLVTLVPADAAGTDDPYLVVLTDPATLAPLLDVELDLPLCAVVEPTPSGSPTAAPTAAPLLTEPSGTPAAEASAGPSDASPSAAPDTSLAAASRPVALRAFSRLTAALRSASRPGPPEVATAPALPELAPGPEAATVPTPVIAYPPGTTGVRLAAPPDRPLAGLLPLQLTAAPAPPAPAPVLLAQGAPPAGLVDALPTGLLAAAAAAGFLATQLRRRVPLRR